MGYSALTGLIKVGWPKPYISTQGTGTEYAYRGDTTTIAANQPLCGQGWADGNPVDYVSADQIDFSNDIVDMTVRTKSTFSSSSAEAEPSLLDTHITVKWLPIDRPLECHPLFSPGGANELSSDDWQAIWGWMAETHQELKAAGQYYLRDSNGEAYGDILNVSDTSDNADNYCIYLQMGYDTFRDYAPLITQRDIYTGYLPPSIGNLGDVDTPPGTADSDYPSGYIYIKNDDSRERTGRRAEYQRFQSWIGVVYVAFDRTHLYT